MKILVLSDSHSYLRFMREAIRAVKPNAVVHLGDYYDDGAAIAQENEHIPFHQVPGNCDKYRCPDWIASTICYSVCGVKLFMTHGHLHYVKSSPYHILEDARKSGAQAVLYGHTHQPVCYKDGDMWVLNPGSCGHSGGSVGLIEADNGEILSCGILTLEDLEAML